MRSKLVTVLLVLIAIAAIAAIVSWIASPAAGGAVLMMLGIGAGVWLGADWGSARAAETEEYRQKLISKSPPVTTYYDINDDDPNGSRITQEMAPKSQAFTKRLPTLQHTISERTR